MGRPWPCSTSARSGVVRERIQLDVPLEPFVGRAEVAGSHDRKTFTRLSSTSIYDVRGATRAVSTAVVFPQSDFRYYRIRATGVQEIRGATAEAVAAAGAPVRAARGDRGAPGGAGERWSTPTSGIAASRCTSSASRRRRPRSTGPSTSTARWTARRTSSPAAAACTASARPARRRCRSTAATAISGSGSGTATTSRSRDLRVTLRAYRDYILLAPGFAPPYRVLYGGPGVRPRLRLRAAARGTWDARGRGARPGAPERGLRAARRHALVRGAASPADPGRAGAGGGGARSRRGFFALRDAAPRHSCL